MPFDWTNLTNVNSDIGSIIRRSANPSPLITGGLATARGAAGLAGYIYAEDEANKALKSLGLKGGQGS